MEEDTNPKVFARPIGWPCIENNLKMTHKFHINKSTILILRPGTIIDYEGDAIVNSSPFTFPFSSLNLIT